MQDAEELLTVIDELTQELKFELWHQWYNRDTLTPWEETIDYKRCQELDKQYQELTNKYT